MDFKDSSDVSNLTFLNQREDGGNNEFLIQTYTNDNSVAEGLIYVCDKYKVDGLKFAEKELAIYPSPLKVLEKVSEVCY